MVCLDIQKPPVAWLSKAELVQDPLGRSGRQVKPCQALHPLEWVLGEQFLEIQCSTLSPYVFKVIIGYDIKVYIGMYLILLCHCLFIPMFRKNLVDIACAFYVFKFPEAPFLKLFLAQVPDHQSRGQSASNSAFCTKWWQPRVMTMMAPFCNEAIHYPLVTNSRANWPNSKSPWFEHAKSSNSSGHSFATCQRIPEPIMVDQPPTSWCRNVVWHCEVPCEFQLEARRSLRELQYAIRTCQICKERSCYWGSTKMNLSYVNLAIRCN